MFYGAKVGWIAWVADEDKLHAYDGSAWGDATNAAHQNVPLLGVNATADTANRLAVSSPATLFNHKGADHQIKVNKNGVSDTASLLFQTGFSGRAEFGLAGDDDFHVKVSADGSAWTEAMVVDGASGNVGLGTPTPAAVLHVRGADSKVALFGDSDTFLNSNHQVEIIGTGSRTPLMIAGGSGLRV